MPILIKKSHHFFTRIPLGLLCIAAFSISPILLGMLGATLSEWTTGQPCHEGNCAWGAIGWLFFLTMPIAGILLVVFMVVVAVDTIKWIRR